MQIVCFIARARRAIGLLAILLVLSPMIGRCEPDQPRQFYEKNYAEAPNVGGEAIKAPEVAVKRERASKNQEDGDDSDSRTAQIDKQLEEQFGAVAREQQRRLRITLYVNSKDKAHFEAAVRAAFHLADTNRSVKVAEIYHIGDYRNVSPEIKKQAAAKKIFMAQLFQMPPISSATHSPTWVLRNMEGTHVVEGLMQIEKCISPKGEYKKPERSMFAPPTATPVAIEKF